MKPGLLISSLLILTGFVSCQKQGDEVSELFSVSPDELSIASEGGSVVVNVTSTSREVKLTQAVGGLCGRSDASSLVGNEKLSAGGCTFSGNILCASSCYEGGFVGYNEGRVLNCTCKGAVLGKSSSDRGPGWACGFNRTSAGFVSNFGYGFVGDYDTYKDNPRGARSSVYSNCMVGNNFDLTLNTVDKTLDTYCDWDAVSAKDIATGVKYTHYNCTGVLRSTYSERRDDLRKPSHLPEASQPRMGTQRLQ